MQAHERIAVIEQGPHGRVLSVPGFVSAHSHAFQREMRGRTQRAAATTGTFWSWRAAMYEIAAGLTPESIYASSRRAFEELAAAGVTAVGEFHYVHHDADGQPYAERTILADQVIRAALDAGLWIALLRVAYARAGAGRAPEGVQRRFCDPSPDAVLGDVDALRARWRSEPRVRIGVAPHSVRAVPRAWLAPLVEYARAYALPLHMHVGEQQAEIDECLAEHGQRPLELLADVGALDARFCAVHATNVTDTEARLLGDARAHACICPTTERDLGDGLADLALLRDHGVRLSVGIDSHVVTDHIEEMRALETHERLRLRRRVTFEPQRGRTPAEQLLTEGSVHGAAALGFIAPDANARAVDGGPHGAVSTTASAAWQARTLVRLDDARSLAGVADEALADALVFSGSGLRFERRT